MQPVKEHTFDNFIIDKSTQFAFLAAKVVADKPGQHYNPLFIYGENGLGKTHLLNAIYNRVHEQNPDAVICILSAEEIVQMMSHTISAKQRDSWNEYFHATDMLLIDDAHILVGNETLQKEFVSILSCYVEKGKQAVMTSSVPPERLSILESSLRVDYKCSLLADIQPLKLETCRVIALDKAVRQGLWLSEESLEYVALQAKGKVHRLERIISRLHAEKELTGPILNYAAVTRACEE